MDLRCPSCGGIRSTIGDLINARARAGAAHVDAKEALAKLKKDDPRRPMFKARVDAAREAEEKAIQAEQEASGR